MSTPDLTALLILLAIPAVGLGLGLIAERIWPPRFTESDRLATEKRTREIVRETR